MADENEQEKDLDNIVKQETNQNTGRAEEQASRAQQSRASSKNSSDKGWSTGQKVIVGGGLLYGSYMLVTGKVKKVWDYFHPVEPKKLGNAALSIGLIYFLLHPASCSKQIKDVVVNDIYTPAKQYALNQKEIKRLQDAKKAQDQKINELMKAKKQSASLDQKADQGYVPQSSQFQPQPRARKIVSSYANPRLGALTKPASVQSLESIFRQSGTNYQHLIYVDKLNQKLILFDIDDGNLSQVREYACTTGMNEGPRESEGDKRTPEGLYIINRCFKDTGNPLLGKIFMGLSNPNEDDQSYGRSGKDMGICGTGLAERIYAIDSKENVTNGGIVVKDPDVVNIYNHIAGSTEKALVLIEDQRRPIKFEK